MKHHLLLLLLGIAACYAQAQTSDFAELTPATHLQKDLTASAGLGVISQPAYLNGSKQRTTLFPLLDLQWKSGVFLSSVSGLGYNFSSDPSWQYGVRLGLLAYQEQSGDNRDNGPGNTPTNIAPGVFANYLVNDRFSVLTALTGGAGVGKYHSGFLASLGGRYIHPVNTQNRVFAILGTTWASRHYMVDYYGVTAQQSADYHFPVYEPAAGMLKTKLALGWDWKIDRNWSLVAGGSLTRLLGDARSSPLASGKTQVVVYSAGYYRF